jgi:hypothetical protein
VKPIIANPKARIEDEAKKRDEPKPQQMKAWKHKCTGDVDISQVRSRRSNQTMPNPKKNYRRKILNPQKLG